MSEEPVQLVHVLYYVSNVHQSIKFFQRLLSFEVVDWLGREAAFLRLPGSREYFDLGLVQVGEEARQTHSSGRRGAYHAGWAVSSRDEFLRIHDAMHEEERVVGLSNHATHLSLYLVDPDGNELEIMYRTAHAPWADGALTTLPFDIGSFRSGLSGGLELR